MGVEFRLRLCALLLLSAFILNSQVTRAQNKVITINAGDSVVLKAPVKDAVAYQWYKNQIPVGEAMSEHYKVTEPGVYTVVAYNSESCSSPLSDGVEIRWAEKAVDMSVSISSAGQELLVGVPFVYHIVVKNEGANMARGVKVQSPFNNSPEFKDIKYVEKGEASFAQIPGSVVWEVGEVPPQGTADIKVEVQANVPGLIVQTAEVSCVEKETDLSNNRAKDTRELREIKIPDVISPNGDGKNDYFEVDLSFFRENELWIFNRWGNTVFHQHNYQNNWDGKGLSEGTYFYQLKVTDAQGKVDWFKGYITLIRK